MRILVTGGGGFLGSRIAVALCQRGHQVVVLGRREYDHLKRWPITQLQGDIADRPVVEAACHGCDAVIHAAARAGLSTRWKPFFQANVLGTRTVLQAAIRACVPRFVYTSSPSVTFAGRSQAGVNESQAYPRRWLAHYPRSKALAEQEVLAANGSAITTCALRPHLIWGPGDPHLAPRLWERARCSRLVRVGSGSNRIDTTYVDNAAWAHVLAVERLEATARHAGKAYYVTDGDPVLCWDWIRQVLALRRFELPERRISFRLAWWIGWLLELGYSCCAANREPPMTRFLAAQLALDHYFDITAIRNDLGYEPLVDRETGLQRWREHLKSSHVDRVSTRATS